MLLCLVNEILINVQHWLRKILGPLNQIASVRFKTLFYNTAILITRDLIKPSNVLMPFGDMNY